MKKFGSICLLLHLICRLCAQDASTNKDLLHLFQKDSVIEIEKLIDTAQQLSATDSANALKFLRAAAAKANRLQIDYLEAQAHFEAGAVNYAYRNYDRSINNYTRSRNIYQKLGMVQQEALSYVYMARSQYYRGNYTLAAQNLNTAIEKGRLINSPLVEAEADEYLGLLYNFFQDFNASIHFSQRALEMKKTIGDEVGYIRVANMLSTVYYDAQRFDSALYYANTALNAAKKKNMHTDVYMAHFSIAAAYIRLKRLNDAAKEINLLRSNDSLKSDINFLIRYYVLLANYSLAKNDKKNCIAYCDTALSIAEKKLYPETRLFIYKNMAESYYAAGDFKTAYAYYRKYNRQLSDMYTGENVLRLAKMEGIVHNKLSENEIKYLNKENEIKQLQLLRETEMRKNLIKENLLKDSILQKEKLLGVAMLKENELHKAKLENEKKLGAALKRENTLQQARLNSEKKLRLTLMLGLCTALAFVGVIFYQYNRQKNKNAIIKKQADELQTLMKEIHHRVKNNMQIVSSLLDLQSFSIEDAHASEAVKESRNRVQSMALIHQNLYNEGNIKGIQMQDYIQNLAQNLFDSYNIEKDKIKLITDIEKLNLDVDTVIPIGLIVNELISNSLKYAFKEKASGEVHVELKKINNELLLKVHDNGNGFPEGWNNSAKHSFGYKLIKAFAQKLKAKLDVYNNDGACFVMRITKFRMA
jgi:two-component sensor histidine kinase